LNNLLKLDKNMSTIQMSFKFKSYNTNKKNKKKNRF